MAAFPKSRRRKWITTVGMWGGWRSKDEAISKRAMNQFVRHHLTTM
jgi:hypothetical protein